MLTLNVPESNLAFTTHYNYYLIIVWTLSLTNKYLFSVSFSEALYPSLFVLSKQNIPEHDDGRNTGKTREWYEDWPQKDR